MVSISLLGINSPMPVLYLLIFVAGATTIGTQIRGTRGGCAALRLVDLAPQAWAGRPASVEMARSAGPLLGGALMAIELPLQLNFMAFAIPRDRGAGDDGIRPE